MSITERDIRALRFIEEVGVASTSQIERAVFAGPKNSGIIARDRMKQLADMGRVKRTRPHVAAEWIYWLEGPEPKQTEHDLLVTEVNVRLRGLPGRIEVWERTPDWGHLRPDAHCEIHRGDLIYQFAIEVQRLTGNPLDQAKYERFYAANEWRKRWPKFPRVIVVSDREPKIATTNIMFIRLPTDLAGIEKIF